MSKKSKKKGFAAIFAKNKIGQSQPGFKPMDKPLGRETENPETIEPGLSVDGYCRIKFTPEGVFLKLIFPLGKGKEIQLAYLEEETGKRGIIDIDWESVKEKLQGKVEEWFLIAPRRTDLDRDASIESEISANGMVAYVSYQPPLGGKYLTIQEMEEILMAAGIVYGLDKEALATLENSNWPVSKLQIAQGSPAQPGEDGFVDYHITVQEGGHPGRLRADGSIDYFDLNIIQNVKENDVLASLVPPKPGVPGYKVTGQEIVPPKLKEARLPGGKNTKTNEAGTQLLAEINGQVTFEGGRINVLPIFQLRGDVDLSTGHINFLGSVIIEGNVAEGLQVKAGGDVVINGHLDAATVISEGDVTIMKGFRGKNKGSIEAKGDLRVKFVENGTIDVRGDLFVGEAIMHSNVKAGGKVTVDGKGIIVGGCIHAGGDVDAKVVGSNLATRTEIKVGVDPLLRDKEANKLNKHREMVDNLKKVEKAITLLAEQDAQGILNKARKDQLIKLRETRVFLAQEEAKVAEELKTLKENIENMQKGAIVVRNRLYPGVRIGIANSNHVIRDERGRTRLIYVDGEIAFSVL